MALYAREARILVVDDNKINLMITKGALSAFQPRIDFAGSGREALQKAAENTYQLIFMDLLMPEMDGIETTSRLLQGKGEKEAPPIVALTGKTEECLEELRSQGFKDYITKPAKKEDLERILRTYLPEALLVAE